MRVNLDNPADAGNLDGAPVVVYFTSTVHSGAIAVPVTVLLALASGGHAVEVARIAQVTAVTATGIVPGATVRRTGRIDPDETGGIAVTAVAPTCSAR